ncbi:MAG TPA: hypothetical protein PLL71_06970 [Agriterribacter sp.]|nr:hypothetical protein [Agriterribacter sp.]HRQ50989.1 hypothetical protein [Agriterribacter sp.]
MKSTTAIFECMAEGKPYVVKATPYLNGREKLRFRVSVNNSAICIFGWDEGLDRYAILKDARDPEIHPAAEMIIAGKLENLFAEKHAA